MTSVTFAEFQRHDRGERWEDIVVRRMGPDDAAAVAAMFSEREGRRLSDALEVVQRWAEPTEQRHVLVAEHRGRLVGYGKSQWLAPQDEGGDAPAGWYLAGLVVTPSARRHGVGARLTGERIEALRSVTDEVWYFASSRNAATIALHRHYGFTLHARDVVVPRVTFAGAQSLLFRLELAAAEPPS